jgi:hypothetical protein
MTESRSIWWYGVNSLFAPRTAARRLMGDSRLPGFAWKLIAMGLLALLMASFIVNLLGDVLAPGWMVSNPPMLADGVVGRLIEAVVYAVVTLLSARIVMFLWTSVMKYREPPLGVLAATSLTVAVMLLLAPLQEALYIAVANASTDVETVAFLGNFIFVIALTAIYYAETLSIGYGRAFWLNAVAIIAAIILLGFLFIFAGFLIWAIGGSLLWPMASG